MNPTATPPALPQARAKSSPSIVLVWAILATAAAGLFALVALYFFVQANTKPMPISVTFRHAAFDSTWVAQLRNNSGSTMKVLVQVESRTTGQSKQAELVVAYTETTEVGWAEGWRFVSGETMRIHHADYKDLVVTVP